MPETPTPASPGGQLRAWRRRQAWPAVVTPGVLGGGHGGHGVLGRLPHNGGGKTGPKVLPLVRWLSRLPTPTRTCRWAGGGSAPTEQAWERKPAPGTHELPPRLFCSRFTRLFFFFFCRAGSVQLTSRSAGPAGQHRTQ